MDGCADDPPPPHDRIFSATLAVDVCGITFVIGNWLSLWDFHGWTTITAAAIAIGFAFNILVYLDCALVSPDFKMDGVVNLLEFHERQGSTYIGAILITGIVAVVLNWVVGIGMGVQNWANQNVLVIAMLVPPIAALLMRKNAWVQVLAPIVLAGPHGRVRFRVLSGSEIRRSRAYLNMRCATLDSRFR